MSLIAKKKKNGFCKCSTQNLCLHMCVCVRVHTCTRLRTHAHTRAYVLRMLGKWWIITAQSEHSFLPCIQFPFSNSHCLQWFACGPDRIFASWYLSFKPSNYRPSLHQHHGVQNLLTSDACWDSAALNNLGSSWGASGCASCIPKSVLSRLCVACSYLWFMQWALAPWLLSLSLPVFCHMTSILRSIYSSKSLRPCF